MVVSIQTCTSQCGLGKRSGVLGDLPPLSCYVMNAGSLANKFLRFHHFLSTAKPDMVFISEIGLSGRINDDEFFVNLSFTPL